MIDVIEETAMKILEQTPGIVVRYRLLRDVLMKASGCPELQQVKYNLKHSHCIQELETKQQTDGMPFQNLVAASDCVFSKPGYGIVSECLANHPPLFYTAWQNFREYEVLVQGVEELGFGKLIPPSDFFTGEWGGYLRPLDTAKICLPKWQNNGATVAVKQLLALT